MLRRPGANLEAGGRKPLRNLVGKARLQVDEPGGRMQSRLRDSFLRP